MFLRLAAAVASTNHKAAQWGRGSSEICVPCSRGFPSGESERCHSHSTEEGNSDSAQLFLLLYPYHISIRGALKDRSQESTSCAQLPCSRHPTSFQMTLGEVLWQLTSSRLPFPPQGRQVACMPQPTPLCMNAGSSSARSSQELPSCCKELYC